VTVVLEAEGPQNADLAPDLAAAFESSPEAAAFFASLATFYRKGYLRWIDGASADPKSTPSESVNSSPTSRTAASRDRAHQTRDPTRIATLPRDSFLHATFVAFRNEPDAPTTHGDGVQGSQGGLAYVAKSGTTTFHSTTKSHAVRGLALGTTPAVLYLCDQAADRVTIYRRDTGEYLGQITGNGLTEPVGIAVHPTTGSLAIGSPGNKSL
jgi:hypothetical protein